MVFFESWGLLIHTEVCSTGVVRALGSIIYSLKSHIVLLVHQTAIAFVQSGNRILFLTSKLQDACLITFQCDLPSALCSVCGY